MQWSLKWKHRFPFLQNLSLTSFLSTLLHSRVLWTEFKLKSTLLKLFLWVNMPGCLCNQTLTKNSWTRFCDIKYSLQITGLLLQQCQLWKIHPWLLFSIHSSSPGTSVLSFLIENCCCGPHSGCGDEAHDLHVCSQSCIVKSYSTGWLSPGLLLLTMLCLCKSTQLRTGMRAVAVGQL